MKTVAHQIQAMRRRWSGFEAAGVTSNQVTWFGSLVGIEKPYRVMIRYGLPSGDSGQPMWRRFPEVRVLSPRLIPRTDASEEAPLPHVYFELPDITLSPLCLFDPSNDEWSHDDLIADTTVPWTADWLACYEGWLATGRWFGGGRHPVTSKKENAK